MQQKLWEGKEKKGKSTHLYQTKNDIRDQERIPEDEMEMQREIERERENLKD